MNGLAMGWLVATVLALALGASFASGLSADTTNDTIAISSGVPSTTVASMSANPAAHSDSALSEGQVQPQALTTKQKGALIGVKSGLLGVGNFVAFAPMVAKNSTSY